MNAVTDNMQQLLSLGLSWITVIKVAVRIGTPSNYPRQSTLPDWKEDFLPESPRLRVLSLAV